MGGRHYMYLCSDSVFIILEKFDSGSEGQMDGILIQAQCLRARPCD